MSKSKKSYKLVRIRKKAWKRLKNRADMENKTMTELVDELLMLDKIDEKLKRSKLKEIVQEAMAEVNRQG